MYAILRLDSNLQLSLDYDYSKKATVVLSRIMAQRLADELQAFANNRKSVDGLREMALPVEMLPPDAVQRGLLTRPPVKLDGHGSKTVRLGTSAKATGVVHLQPAAPKKGGVLYLDQTGTKGKLPVVRLKR